MLGVTIIRYHLQRTLTQAKKLTSQIQRQHSHQQLLQLYNSHKQHMNEVHYSLLINKLVTTSTHTLPITTISICLQHLLTQVAHISNLTFTSMLNGFCLQSFPSEVLDEDRKQEVRKEIVKRFKNMRIKQKSYVFKYIKKHDLGVAEQVMQMEGVVAEGKCEDVIFYLHDYLQVVKENTNCIQPMVAHIYEDLHSINAKMLWKFVSCLKPYPQHLQQEKIVTHIETLLGTNLPAIEYMYLLQTIHLLNKNSPTIIKQIVDKLKDKYMGQQRQQLAFSKVVQLNILLQMMVLLQCMDEELFLGVENKFIDLFPHSPLYDVKSFINVHNSLIKVLISKSQYTKVIKKEHITFTHKVIKALDGAKHLSLMHKLSIISECQHVSVKSRELKRTFKEFISNHDAVTQAQLELVDVIIGNY